MYDTQLRQIRHLELRYRGERERGGRKKDTVWDYMNDCIQFGVFKGINQLGNGAPLYKLRRVEEEAAAARSRETEERITVKLLIEIGGDALTVGSFSVVSKLLSFYRLAEMKKVKFSLVFSSSEDAVVMVVVEKRFISVLELIGNVSRLPFHHSRLRFYYTLNWFQSTMQIRCLLSFLSSQFTFSFLLSCSSFR